MITNLIMGTFMVVGLSILVWGWLEGLLIGFTLIFLTIIFALIFSFIELNLKKPKEKKNG